MISNEEACEFYHGLNPPGVFENAPFSLQIARGKSPFEWNPGGCQRNAAIFDKFNVIPEFCFGCYKVQVQPRTVVELFKLLMLFEKSFLPINHLRKCMVELRADTPGAYKGFVFCRGLDDGEELCDFVSRKVADEISPHISVELKRGCSHFGVAYPEFASVRPGVEPMKYNETWRVYEDDFDKTAVYRKPPPDRGKTNDDGASRFTPAEVFAMTYWLGYAATIGDASYLTIAGTTLPPIPGLKRPPFVQPDLSS